MRLNELIREIFNESFPPKRVLFRVDAGRVSGLSFGHLCRCIILAKELENFLGSEAIFLMRDYPEGILHAKISGYSVRTLSSSLPKSTHDSTVMEYISSIKPDWLVVDLPEEDPNPYLEYARENQVFTVSIDDTANKSYHSDVILNSSILADRNAYGDCLPTTRFLIGTDYFIMDDYIVKRHRAINRDSLSVLITFGGTDLTGLTKNVVCALSKLTWKFVNFTVILGPGFKDRISIIDAARPLGNKITIVNYPKDMKKLFLENDLAVCAGGRTLYELNKIGIPCVAIASNKNEALVIKKFIEKGLLLSGLEAWDDHVFLKQLEYTIHTSLKHCLLKAG